ncbi:hypothetical protein ILYODFUR_032593 [Ilyodon furcidens]|uniref:Uncharacterized protein n=1 Tax=Ilyodon furcidens TaxID=33524 RepID=A0ABV0U2H5_9TELE
MYVHLFRGFWGAHQYAGPASFPWARWWSGWRVARSAWLALMVLVRFEGCMCLRYTGWGFAFGLACRFGLGVAYWPPPFWCGECFVVLLALFCLRSGARMGGRTGLRLGLGVTIVLGGQGPCQQALLDWVSPSFFLGPGSKRVCLSPPRTERDHLLSPVNGCPSGVSVPGSVECVWGLQVSVQREGFYVYS